MKLLFILSLLALPAAVNAQFVYATNGNSLTIQYYNGSGGAVVIPSSFNGDAVTRIGADAFFGINSITSVAIPGSITNIGNYAFFSCASLTNFSVDSGNGAYSSSNGVLFDKAQSLLIQYPAGLTNSSYTIPSSVTNVGQDAFSGCTGVGSIVISSSIISIGSNAFWDCASLTNVIIPDSATSIGQQAFGLCTSLASVTLPNGVTNIGEDAFVDCTNLTGVSIPNGLVSIGEDAFYECFSLTNIVIPSSLTNIAEGALYDCTRLTNISVDSGNQAYSSLSGVLFDKAQDVLIQYPGGRTNGTYTIPNTVTSIGPEACDNPSLAGVTLPIGLTNIGNYAFQNCASLTGVNIPNSVVRIGGFAFNGCAGLGSVTLGNGVTSIGQDAFSGCGGLTSVTIPSSVTNIGDYAFESCANLTSAYFQGNAPPDDGTVFSDDPATVYYLPGTMGWHATFGGVSTAIWFLSQPEILSAGPRFGVESNQFGFTVSWATNGSVVLDASTNLAGGLWIPIATNALSNGTFYFSDPNWGNFQERFYRLRAF